MEEAAGFSPKLAKPGLLTSLTSFSFILGLTTPCPPEPPTPFIIDRDEKDGLLTSTGLDMPRPRGVREDGSL